MNIYFKWLILAWAVKVLLVVLIYLYVSRTEIAARVKELKRRAFTRIRAVIDKALSYPRLEPQ